MRRGRNYNAAGERYVEACFPSADLPDKRAARIWGVYRHALTAPKIGHAITLAGTSTAEVSLLRDYLKWPSERAWFVDWAKTVRQRPAVLRALANIQRAWPAANVRRADINDVLPELYAIGFAHLDFMGCMRRDSIQPCVRTVISQLLPGGVFGLTWYRGREVFSNPRHCMQDIHNAALDIPGINDRRWAGTLRLVESWAKAAHVRLEMVGGMEYRHNSSSMSVTTWRRVK